MQGLSKLGYQLISTGGSAKAIEAAGVSVSHVEDVTRFPEMLHGVHSAVPALTLDAFHAWESASCNIIPVGCRAREDAAPSRAWGHSGATAGSVPHGGPVAAQHPDHRRGAPRALCVIAAVDDVHGVISRPLMAISHASGAGGGEFVSLQADGHGCSGALL